MKKTIFAVALAAVVMLTGCSSTSKAKNTANDFMKYLKEESFYDLSTVSSYSIVELIDMFTGINVIEYSVKSVSDEHKTWHTCTTQRSEDNPDWFEDDKEVFGWSYPDYEVIIDTADEYTIRSKERILSEYTVVYDVQYSNILGNEKRNSLTLVITQKEPDSDEYQVTKAYGIY